MVSDRNIPCLGSQRATAHLAVVQFHGLVGVLLPKAARIRQYSVRHVILGPKGTVLGRHVPARVRRNVSKYKDRPGGRNSPVALVVCQHC